MRNCVHGDGFCLTCSQLEDARNLIASYEYDKLPALSAQVEALKKERDDFKWKYENESNRIGATRLAEINALRARAEAAESESTRLKAELAKAEKRGFEKMRLAVVLFFQEKLEAARQQESKNGVILFEKWLEFFNDYRFDGGTHHVQ